MDTNELIAKLSADGPCRTCLYPPSYFSVRLVAILAIYTIVAQLYLGLRPDIAVQLVRPLFVLELVLLTGLILTSTVAATLSMYPDFHQKPWMLRVPYGVFAFLAALVLAQLFFKPEDPRMVVPLYGGHAMECTLCIAVMSLVPTALIVGVLRKGASVHPFHAGVFAVLASSGTGCLALRFEEANDSPMHLVEGHYLPTLLFSVLGAIVGKKLLKW